VVIRVGPWVALTLFLGSAACASIWGFGNFTEDDGGFGGDGAAVGDGGSSDAPCAESSTRCSHGGE
jgi:hypothetical protein